jgi:hypothetical protein
VNIPNNLKEESEMQVNPLVSVTTEQVQDVADATQKRGPWQFTLDYPRPPKGLSANDSGVHWATRNGSIQDVRMEVFAKTRALHIGVLERIQVDLTWIVKDRRKRDAPNLWPFSKAICDGIASNKGVSAHLVDDDDDEHLIAPTPTICYIKGARPRFIVTITDLSVDES